MRLIERMLERYLADGKLTETEWRRAELVLRLREPKRASEAGRMLVRAMFTKDMSDATRQDVAEYVRSRGYDAPVKPKKPKAHGERAAERVIRSNVTETDVAFTDLMRRTGRDKGAAITIGVLDGGFNAANQSVAEKALPGHDYDDGDDDVRDAKHGRHGAHVAGIATQGTDMIKFRPAVVLVSGSARLAKICEAIDDAVAGGARVITMSIKVDSAEEVRVLKAMMAQHPGVLFLKSAGNNGATLGEGAYAADTFLPTNEIDNMVVVGNATSSGKLASDSNRGAPYVTVAANGTSVLSTVGDEEYADMSGTSMATPVVANLAAKILLLDPGLTPAQVKQLLIDTTDKNEHWKGEAKSGGVINPEHALRLAAYFGLVRRGVSSRAAAHRVGLSAKELSEAKRLAPAYVE